MSEEIKNILQEKFEDFEPQPTRDLWAGIEAEIQPGKRLAAAWWYAAAAAVTIMIAVVLWPDSATVMETSLPIASTTEEVVPPAETLQPIPPMLASEEQQKKEYPTRRVEQVNPKTTKITNTKNSSLAIQPKTLSQTKEAEPKVQLMAVASPTPTTISVAEAIPSTVALQTLKVPLESTDRQSLKNLDFPELKPESMVSFASVKLEEWGVRSPIRYQQQEQKSLKQTKSRFQLMLGKFSITHTSHKPI